MHGSIGGVRVSAGGSDSIGCARGDPPWARWLAGERLGIVTFNPGNLTHQFEGNPQKIRRTLSQAIRAFVTAGASVICIQDFALHEVGLPPTDTAFLYNLATDLRFQVHLNQGYLSLTHSCLCAESSLEQVFDPATLDDGTRARRHWRTVQVLTCKGLGLGVVNVHTPVGHARVKVAAGQIHDHTCTPLIKRLTLRHAAHLVASLPCSVVCGDFNCKTMGGCQWVSSQLALVAGWCDEQTNIEGFDGDFIVSRGLHSPKNMNLDIGKSTGDSDAHQAVGCLFTVSRPVSRTTILSEFVLREQMRLKAADAELQQLEPDGDSCCAHAPADRPSEGGEYGHAVQGADFCLAASSSEICALRMEICVPHVLDPMEEEGPYGQCSTLVTPARPDTLEEAPYLFATAASLAYEHQQQRPYQPEQQQQPAPHCKFLCGIPMQFMPDPVPGPVQFVSPGQQAQVVDFSNKIWNNAGDVFPMQQLNPSAHPDVIVREIFRDEVAVQSQNEKLRDRMAFLLPICRTYEESLFSVTPVSTLRILRGAQDTDVSSDQLTGSWTVPSWFQTSDRFEVAIRWRDQYLDRCRKPHTTELTGQEVFEHILKPWQTEWIQANKPHLVRITRHGGQLRRRAFNHFLHRAYEIPKVLHVLLQVGYLPDAILDRALKTCAEWIRPHPAAIGGAPAPTRSTQRRPVTPARDQRWRDFRALMRKRREGVCEECSGCLPSNPSTCGLCVRKLCGTCLHSDRRICGQCPPIDCVLDESPPSCQICRRPIQDQEKLARCLTCQLFGCWWCQHSDRIECRVCPRRSGHRWPRRVHAEPPPSSMATWAINVCKGRWVDP